MADNQSIITVVSTMEVLGHRIVVHESDSKVRYITGDGVELILGMEPGQFNTSKNSKYMKDSMREAGMKSVKCLPINSNTTRITAYPLYNVIELAKVLVIKGKAKDKLISSLIDIYTSTIKSDLMQHAIAA